LAGSVRYCLQDAIDIRQNLIVPESEYSIVALLDSPAAKLIACCDRPFGVLSAIELNYQMALLATEVSDESADWKLAAESQAIKASRAEMMPESEFSIGLAASQLSRAGKSQRDEMRIGQRNLSLTLSLDKEREQNVPLGVSAIVGHVSFLTQIFFNLFPLPVQGEEMEEGCVLRYPDF